MGGSRRNINVIPPARRRPARNRLPGYARTNPEAKRPSTRETRRSNPVGTRENTGRQRRAPAAVPAKQAAYTAPAFPRPKESGTPIAVPARKKGTARRKKNKANAGQEEGCHRRRKGSNGTCWEIRNASSNEDAARRTAQAKTFSGSLAIRGRSRWRATPEAPKPSIAWEMISGTKWGQKRKESRRIRKISSAMAAAERRKTAGTTRPCKASVAKEAHEDHREDVALGEGAVGPFLEEHQVLGQKGSSDRHDHPSPVPQLSQRGRRPGTPDDRAGNYRTCRLPDHQYLSFQLSDEYVTEPE